MRASSSPSTASVDDELSLLREVDAGSTESGVELLLDDDVLVEEPSTLLDSVVLLLEGVLLLDSVVLLLDSVVLLLDSVVLLDDSVVLLLDSVVLLLEEVLLDEDVLLLDDEVLLEDEVLLLDDDEDELLLPSLPPHTWLNTNVAGGGTGVGDTVAPASISVSPPAPM